MSEGLRSLKQPRVRSGPCTVHIVLCHPHTRSEPIRKKIGMGKVQSSHGFVHESKEPEIETNIHLFVETIDHYDEFELQDLPLQAVELPRRLQIW